MSVLRENEGIEETKARHRGHPPTAFACHWPLQLHHETLFCNSKVISRQCDNEGERYSEAHIMRLIQRIDLAAYQSTKCIHKV